MPEVEEEPGRRIWAGLNLPGLPEVGVLSPCGRGMPIPGELPERAANMAVASLELADVGTEIPSWRGVGWQVRNR